MKEINNKLTLYLYDINDINHKNIVNSVEYTIEEIDDVKCMYAKTGVGYKTETITKIELFGLMGATGNIEEVKDKIIKSWVDNGYSIDVIDDDGNIIDR